MFSNISYDGGMTRYSGECLYFNAVWVDDEEPCDEGRVIWACIIYDSSGNFVNCDSFGTHVMFDS